MSEEKNEVRVTHCDTCKSEITDDLCRFFVLDDKDHNPRVVFFHWFSPCWTIEEFSKNILILKSLKQDVTSMKKYTKIQNSKNN